ncbi:MAG TPA: PIG-L family deacetylase [Fimbriimonadaceae bacterium]|nr:PIG-L family deacetylase [Fimbriimonadaceae bacterium]
MKLFDPDPDLRWLFVMAHPDDELAIAAWMHRLRGFAADVRVLWMHSTPVREAESRRAMDVLRVSANSLTFLDAPDGDLCDHLAEYLPRVEAHVARASPDRIVTTAFEQGHLDHDATNLLVNRSAGIIPVLEVPLYHGYFREIMPLNRFADPIGQEILELTREEQRLVKRVARLYPSQTIWRNLVWSEVLSWIKLRPTHLLRTERMRLQTWRDYRRPHLPANLARRVESSPRWARWLAAMDEFGTK